MAEPEQKAEEKKEGWPIINRLKEIGRKIGLPFHFRIPRGYPATVLPTYTALQRKLNFKIVADRNNKMIEAERNWDGGTPETNVNNAGYLKKEIIELYEHLGHFYDGSALQKEYNAFSTGTPLTTDSIKMNINGLGERQFVFSIPKDEEIVFNHGLKYKIAAVGIRSVEYITTFNEEINAFCNAINEDFKNTNLSNDIKQRIEKQIRVIKEQLKVFINEAREKISEIEDDHRKYLSDLQSERLKYESYLVEIKKKRMKVDWVKYRHTYKVIKQYILVEVGYAEKKITIDEKSGDVFKIEDGKKIKKEIPVYFNPEINPLRDEVEEINKKLSTLDRNTVVNRIRKSNAMVIELEKRLMDINNSLQKRIVRFFSESIEKEKSELSDKLTRLKGIIDKLKAQLRNILELEIRRDQLNDFLSTPHVEQYINSNIHLKNFTKKANEVDWGLDENGWPLEVADEEYAYEGRGIKKGTILLDLFNKDWNPREVPYEFTEDCDLLDMAVWVYVSYDSYRDDLRDGRYHPNSLSVMEYILQLQRMKTPYLRYEPANLNQDIKEAVEDETKHATAIMRLNKLPPGKSSQVDVTIKPSHLNPALDLRVKDADIHLGRRLYYDLQENLFNEMTKNPTITTRGAALYILANVIEEVKTWDDVLQLLDMIGKETNGFDIGPNIQLTFKEGKPTLKRWGQKLTRNPFRPITTPPTGAPSF